MSLTMVGVITKGSILGSSPPEPVVRLMRMLGLRHPAGTDSTMTLYVVSHLATNAATPVSSVTTLSTLSSALVMPNVTPFTGLPSESTALRGTDTTAILATVLPLTVPSFSTVKAPILPTGYPAGAEATTQEYPPKGSSSSTLPPVPVVAVVYAIPLR